MTQVPTRLRFTKMHGAGNDFVVLDTTRDALAQHAGLLTPELIRRLGDRRFGVGADQILVVAPPPAGDDSVDFSYRIFNNTGDEVEHCGNGARCFARYVREHGLTQRDRIRVATMNNRLELQVQPDGRVTVDMNVPRFEPASLPFDASGLVPRAVGGYQLWPLSFDAGDGVALHAPVEVAIASMGNPHAVLLVDDVDTAPVGSLGPLIEHHPRFPRRVNAGFLQVVSRSHVRLRVYERDAGETLACGTGACAAVVTGIRLGWLDPRVDVDARGGRLTIEWAGGPEDRVWMTGPATTVYEGEFAL